MPKTLQLRRGTTAEITANTPASGELFVDTEKKTVTVGDGATAGGIILARNDRVSDVYNTANAVNGMATGAYAAANTKIAAVSGTTGRITASGTTSRVLDLDVSGVNARTYGDTQLQSPVITVDQYGRITSAQNTSVSAASVRVFDINSSVQTVTIPFFTYTASTGTQVLNLNATLTSQNLTYTPASSTLYNNGPFVTNTGLIGTIYIAGNSIVPTGANSYVTGTANITGSLAVTKQINGGYAALSADTLEHNFSANTTYKTIINNSVTLTATVPPAGSQAVLILKTGNTTNPTVTLGTGFTSSGTVSLGATADKHTVVSFVSDGTTLFECSRVGPI